MDRAYRQDMAVERACRDCARVLREANGDGLNRELRELSERLLKVADRMVAVWD
jgi:hypothetical protein